jgi:tetratricopeptide (TPR) repeat protein
MEDHDTAGAIDAIGTIASEVAQQALEDIERSGLLLSCSSMLINCGSRIGDRSAIKQGRDLALQALAEVETSSSHAWACRYNIANSLVEEADVDASRASGERTSWEPLHIAHRLEHREALRDARSLLFAIVEAENADSRTRSAACCNLASALDTSGRWAEAYTFYLRALEIRPDNGNAAGNIAQLLTYRIRSGVGQTGHLAAVYDYYVTLAQSLREGTISFAGSDVADLWDALEMIESPGHFSHGPAEGDEYQKWIAHHRLALSPVVEGFGTDDRRWDTAAISHLYGPIDRPELPPIVGEMNVLKADFLVSRRLAFDGTIALAEGELEQQESDPGYYIDTLDYALYGVPYSMLLLAQRSTLDVLDKTAVVANEYFNCGMLASKVSFRSFWADTPGHIRMTLVKGTGRALPALALAELALDMSPEGMYVGSQDLRNAGTHRIVHAALLGATGVTRDSRSSIELGKLLESTVLALQVTRSAYLYLIDLVAMWNDPNDHPGPYAQLPVFEYSPTNNEASPEPIEEDG